MAHQIAKGIASIRLDRPQDYDGRSDGRSTIYSMSIAPGSTVYRYDVTIVKAAENERNRKELTKQNDTGLRTVQRAVCQDIMEALNTKTNGFEVGAYWAYDGKSTLYTTKPVKLPNQKARLASSELPHRAAIFLRNEPAEISITPNEATYKLDYSNIASALVADVTVQADRSVRMFLEILTSQFVVSTNAYQAVSAGSLFENNTTDLVPGMQMRVGFKKGVRVGGEKGKPTAFVVVDMKRTAFFAQKKLSEIYGQFVRGPNDRGGARNFERLLKGVRCRVVYDISKTMLFGQLSVAPLNDRQYNVKGMSVPDYMRKEKNINLQNPSWPGMHPDQPGGRQILYPLECLEIVEGQLVPVEKLTRQASQKLLLENAVRPEVRYTYVQQQVNKLATGEAAQFLKHFGVSIDVNSNSIELMKRRLPKIIVANKKTIEPQANGSWFSDAKNAKFIEPSSKLKRWIVVYDTPDVAAVKQYIEGLMKCATSAGMTLPAPLDYRQASGDQLQAVFEAAQKECQFVFFIDDEFKNSHDKLKLYEAYYKVLTQHVVVKNLRAGPQTVKNVLMKTNCKCFGLNFLPTVDQDMRDFSLDNDDLLIIGLDVSHPQKMGAKEKFDLKKKYPDLANKHPSVVGVCANKVPSKWGFAGDFFYQQSQRESISPTRLRVAIRQLVEMAKANGRTPKRVIVVRDGLSEGQLQQAALEEFPSVKAGIKDVFPSLDPKVTFIVATKDHNKRFYRQVAGNKIENSAVGDIVDSKVVRSDVPEFYQQTHHPLKGVPKMLQVDIVVNELGMSITKIQKLMLLLANMHQVCACPTSMPLPVYLAKETAKRGMNIYNELYAMSFPPRVKGPVGLGQNFRSVDGIFDFDDLTEKLSYHSHKLGATRYNA